MIKTRLERRGGVGLCRVVFVTLRNLDVVFYVRVRVFVVVLLLFCRVGGLGKVE